MRRSGAPSAQSSAKRLRFLTPFVDRERECFLLDQENDFMPPSIPSSKPETFSSKTFSNATEVTESPNSGRDTTNDTCRSTDEILKLITESVSEPSCETNATANKNNSENNWDKIPFSEKIEYQDFEKTDFNRQHSAQYACVKPKAGPDINRQKWGQLPNLRKEETKQKLSPEKTDMKFPSSQSECDSANTNRFCFSVMYCKRSSKKHKVWEGDGVLVFSNRSAVLKDMDGKVIDRGIGYKLKQIEELEEGSKFCIGGKECEIQCRISVENSTVEDSTSPVCKSSSIYENEKSSM